jgi:hypothetical protein
MNIFLASADYSPWAFLGGGTILLLIIIGVLYSLFPLLTLWFLWRGRVSLLKIREENAASSTAMTEELQRQNILTRQLLRAYGHEPEA